MKMVRKALAINLLVVGVWLAVMAAAGNCRAQSAQVWRTGQTTSYYAGDDGAQQYGVSWPTPRFTNADGTVPVSGDVVLDQLTGLVWLLNANPTSGAKTWQGALNYIAAMNSGSGTYGRTDWRLPNRKELRSLIDFSQYNPALPQGHPFTNVQQAGYWSSTTNAINTSKAWAVGLSSGDVNFFNKTDSNFVWPVRSARDGASGNLTISGTVKNSRTGEAVQGIGVSATPSDAGSSTTDASGYFSITGLAAGSYTVSAGKAGFYKTQTHSTTIPSDTPDDFTVAPDVTIAYISVSTSTPHAGETIQIIYTLTNTGDAAETVWLGASHRKNGSTGSWEDDAGKDASGHDQPVTVPVGTGQTFTRLYTLPAGDTEGACDLKASLWETKDTATTLMQRQLDTIVNQNTFTISSGAAALDCTSPVSIRSGIPYNGTTAGAGSNIAEYYGFEEWNESGPEVVHVITTSEEGTIRATVTDASDLDVFILRECSPDACLAGNWSQAQYGDAPAGTYYIVVDGFDGASGAYTLQVDFEPNAPTYVLSGKVTNRHTGEAVENVTMTMSPAAADPVATSADGYYALAGIPSGAYSVTAAKAGFYKSNSQSRTVTADVTGCDFSLTPAVTIDAAAPGNSLPRAGETVQLTYTLSNSGEYAATVWLGASHRQSGTAGLWEDDAYKDAGGHDQAVTVQPGTGRTFTRYYTIPVEDVAGAYDLTVSLWETKDTGSGLMQQLLDKVEYLNTFTITMINPTISKKELQDGNGLSIQINGYDFTANKTAVLHIRKPDGTEYPTQNIRVDAYGLFTVQIPPAADYLSGGQYACRAVDATTGKASNEVIYIVPPAVAELHHFEITRLSTVWEDTPFSVTITAKDSDNATMPGVNAELLLSCAGMAITPAQVTMQNGTVTFNLIVPDPSPGVTLQCFLGTITGTSNTFTVAAYGTSLAPVAKFEASPLSGQAPLQVAFTDNSTGNITGWFWDFGDNTTSTEQHPEHIYTAEGSYTIMLNVTGSYGQDTITNPSYITVDAVSDSTTTTILPATSTITVPETTTTVSSPAATTVPSGGGSSGGGGGGGGSSRSSTTTTVAPTTTVSVPAALTTTTTIVPPPLEVLITSKPGTTAFAGILYTYGVKASVSNNEGSTLYAFKKAPDGMTISTDGVISWKPRISQVGTHEVLVSVVVIEEGGISGSAEQSFQISVELKICPARFLLNDNEQELAVLRQFRDTQLAKSAPGLSMITLYYLHGNELTAILASHPPLLLSARQLLRELLPVIQTITARDTRGSLTTAQVYRACALLRLIRQEASPALQKSITFVLNKIDTGELIKAVNK